MSVWGAVQPIARFGQGRGRSQGRAFAPRAALALGRTRGGVRAQAFSTSAKYRPARQACIAQGTLGKIATTHPAGFCWFAIAQCQTRTPDVGVTGLRATRTFARNECGDVTCARSFWHSVGACV